MKRTLRYLAEVMVVLVCLSQGHAIAQTVRIPAVVNGVHSIGMTVSDMDRALAFYTGILSFEKSSDVEVSGEPFERLYGVFGLRMRVVTLRLGEEILELTEFLTPQGRPMPTDSRA